jgi:hypothetical protein
LGAGIFDTINPELRGGVHDPFTWLGIFPDTSLAKRIIFETGFLQVNRLRKKEKHLK